MEELKINIRKQSSVERKLMMLENRIKEFLDMETKGVEVPTDKIELLKLRSEKDRLILDEFNDIQIKIECSCDDESVEGEFKVREEFETHFYNTIASMERLLIEYAPKDFQSDNSSINSGRSQSPNVEHTNFHNIKLPTIQLPKFKGLYTEWLEYKETFESLIHKNPSINKIQKFHYLRASLEGSAVQVIQSIEFSEFNYDTAWEVLSSRYDNNQILIHNHIKAIFDLPIINKPTSFIIRKVIDDISKHLKALNSLNLPTDHWDMLIIHIIIEKLDKETLKYWEEYKNSSELPTLSDLKAFLKSRADVLETLESRDSNKRLDSKQQKQVSLFTKNFNCVFCNGNHLIYKCDKFLKLTTQEKIEQVKKLKLCNNCLRKGHFSGSCPSSSCRKCNKKHNTLIHFEKSDTHEITKEPSSGSQVMLSNQGVSHSLLATVSILVHNSQGEGVTCRAILDCGSQTNFISSSFFKQLELASSKAHLSIIGINQITSSIDSRCDLKIKSRLSSYTSKLTCYIIPKISDNLPIQNINIDCAIPKNIQLADPQFNESHPIDMLLGAPVFWDVLKNGKLSSGRNKPVVQNTQFGWVVAGPMHIPVQSSHFCCNLSTSTNPDIQGQIERFWEIEECSTVPTLSIQEEHCEELFLNNFSRDVDGRYIVGIPFKESIGKLGDSKLSSLKRFYSLERKLQSNVNLKGRYNEFMLEYETLGHMTKQNISVGDDVDCFYLPHHGVLKEGSLTTKLRVVFDGSASSTSGWCLNDLQHSGPVLQQDLFSILIRFRQHNVVFTADINKMYRQILINPEHRRYQRFWWRSNPSDNLSIYELNTVTYGLTSAPYLAIRCLHQLAIEHATVFPEASNIIKRDMYVDDLISGAHTQSDAIRLCKEIFTILLNGCFELRKWASNDQTILQTFDEEYCLSHLQDFGDDTNKTLGLQWSSGNDTLMYRIHKYKSTVVTKRSMLSEIAQIYDPLGLLAPCIIEAKCILQRLWCIQISWDEPVPDDITREWLHLRQVFQSLNLLTIPRHVVCNSIVKLELHGFSDASCSTYGACIYARSMDVCGNITVNLFCAKSKVAPLKTTTIPRLELCGAQVLANLMSKVKNSITIETECYYWTDSQIVLAWLKLESSHLQTFVSHRVGDIQRKTIIDNWRHIRSADNPADLISRGVQPEHLKDKEIWWHGPVFLSNPEESWSISQVDASCVVSELPEMKKHTKVFSAISSESNAQCFLFNHVSNLVKLKRLTALCLRFIHNCKVSVEFRQVGPLAVSDLRKAFNRLIFLAQHEVYSEEIRYLRLNQYLQLKHKLVSLSPFIDKEGLLRVGGRIKHSSLPFDHKHPLLLPRKHPLSKLIFQHEHIKLYHAGPQLLLSSTRTQVWVVNGRNLARKIVRECTRCFRVNPQSINPIMGDLPENRVQPVFPFMITGLDYAGPFLIRERRGRGVKRFKCYISLFICMTTKALHLEVVTDLTKESFLNSFRRFIARRGKPTHLYSDNGTTYVGADNELSQLRKFLQDNHNDLSTHLTNENIQWHFIPPYSPNFGGIWEAAVKSTKYHLKRVLANSFVTLEEFMTVLCGIEGILNSRPISSMSSDPNDLEPLTPAHFLLGRQMQSIPEADLSSISVNRLSNFQHLQFLQQQFWKRWTRDYLTELQQRSRWKTNPEAIKLDSVVLLKEDNTPPFCWKMARIVATHPGEDGVVRVVSVKTKQGLFKRAINKVCALPI